LRNPKADYRLRKRGAKARQHAQHSTLWRIVAEDKAPLLTARLRETRWGELSTGELIQHFQVVSAANCAHNFIGLEHVKMRVIPCWVLGTDRAPGRLQSNRPSN
jgi:hypothetical protein